MTEKFAFRRNYEGNITNSTNTLFNYENQTTETRKGEIDNRVAIKNSDKKS